MHIFEFDSFRVDTLRRVLLHDDEKIRLPSKAFEILLVLLEAEGRLVEKDELMRRVWPDSVVEENNLTVNMSALRKALAESPGEHKYVVTVPGRGYQFVAKVQQNHESIPIQRNVESAAAHETIGIGSIPVAQSRISPVRKTRLAFWFVVAALIVGSAVIFYVYYSRNRAANSEASITSIAVLPFANETGDPNTEYLSDGIAETLINRLSQLPGLKVIARSSTFKYKGTRSDPKDIANELGVQAILIGRVTQRGENLSISTELVNASDKTQIWGEQYDRKMSDLVAIQRDISREIIGNLKLKVSPGAKETEDHYTENNEAYQLYLKGRFYWNKRTVEALDKAIEYFKQAIEKDPGFALAYVGLADSYVVPANRLPPRESMPKAKEAALRALEINERLAEAHATLGRALASYDWDWPAAEKEFKRAVELNPNYAVAHQWYGGYFGVMGRPEEAISERRLAVELEPLSLIINFELGSAYYFARDYDRALEQFQKTLELDQNFPPATNFLPAVYEQKRMYAEALSGFRKARSITLGSEGSLATSGLGHLYAVTGKRSEALKLADELKQLSSREYVPATSVALIYAGLGDKDQAFEWLERAYDQHAFQLQWITLEPRFDNLRSDPRFQDLLKRMRILQ